jgi:hypothetical protein
MQGQSNTAVQGTAAQDTVPRDIPWEKWNLLSSDEITFLKSLNFNLLTEKGKKERKVKTPSYEPAHATAPSAHILEVMITCSFCKANFSVYFDMKAKGPCLHGKRISEEHFSHLRYEKGKKSEQMNESAVTCENCESMLSQKSKSELTAIILQQQIKIKTGRR